MADPDTDTVKHFKYGPETPEWAPAYWEGYTDTVNPFDAFAEAWDQFREFGYSDLRELADRLKERAHKAGQTCRQEAARATSSNGEPSAGYLSRIDDPVVRRISRVNTYFWNRAKAAEALARYWEEKGPPPEWEDLSEAEQEAADPVPDGLYERRIWALYQIDGEGTAKEQIKAAIDLLVEHDKHPAGLEGVRRYLRDKLKEEYTFPRLNGDKLRELTYEEADRLGIAKVENWN